MPSIKGHHLLINFDFVNWEWTWAHAGQTGLDIVGLLPVVGGVKYIDEGKALIKGAGKVPNKVTDLAKDMKDWLGKDARVITNKNRDKVFMSGDGTKRIRFDINNTSPHNNPHGHVEELVNGKWVKSGPIYPIDVLHN